MQASTYSDAAYRLFQDIFANVNGQLQFAETKNAALIAANVAVIVGIGAILAADSIDYQLVRIWLFVTCFGLAGAALISLVSILPIFGPERHDMVSQVGDGAGGNLIFFGDIRSWDPLAYASAVLAIAGVNDGVGKLYLDLANQIVINAGIAHRKFSFFKVAAMVTATTAVVPVAVLGFVWGGAGFRLF